jgi:hypothetical protein
MIFTAAVGISAIDIKKFRFSKAFPLIVVAASITAVIAILDKMVYKQVSFGTDTSFFVSAWG